MMASEPEVAPMPSPPKRRIPPKIETRLTEDGEASAIIDGDMRRIHAATGGGDLTGDLLKQLVLLAAKGDDLDDSKMNFALGLVDAMEPRDATEALLCGQMAAIHLATMNFAWRLNQAKNLQQQDSSERALNKLARTFTAQIETLKRYRSKGQQTVRVERVTVQDGGQAIVGNIETGGAGQ